MQFLRLLESMRTGIGDFFFATVTHLGEETFFLSLADAPIEEYRKRKEEGLLAKVSNGSKEEVSDTRSHRLK